MISCLFHQPAIRRHLGDNQPLPARAESHLAQCAHCRDLVRAHSAIIVKLANQKPANFKAPAFLHARIMNALQTPAATRSQFVPVLRWAIPTLLIAATATLLLTRKTPPQQFVEVKIIPKQLALKATIPENPLETEIQNLCADTLNAARALAANFLPSQ
jgi:hypothetical protein